MRKFIVFSTQRSGSTFFLRYLGSHPSVHCGEEIFIREEQDAEYEKDRFYHYCSLKMSRRLKYGLVNASERFLNPLFNRRMSAAEDPLHDRWLSLIQGIRPKVLVPVAWSFLDQYFNSHGVDTKAAGFKLMYNQTYPLGLSPLDFIRKGFRVIHWIRRNPLKIYISGVRKDKSGVVHTSSDVPQIRVELETGNLLKRLSYISNRISYYRELLSGTSSMEMYYEHFSGNEEKEILKVLEFLEIEKDVTLSTELRKITSENLSEVLSNYHEVKKCLENSKFERYLY